MSPPSRNQLTKVPNPRPARPHSFSCIRSSAGRHRAAAKPIKVTIPNEARTTTNVTVLRWFMAVSSSAAGSRSRAEWRCGGPRSAGPTEFLAFDQWLFNYAQAWLESARPAPILGHAESALNELRLKLMERIEFWKAEGRRYVTNQKAFQRAKMEAVDAGWLRIQSMRLGGAKLSDCLKEAYDHHAGLFAKAGEPLSETVLNLTIPVLVFSGAIHHKWIPYPLIRPVGERVVDNFLEDVH